MNLHCPLCGQVLNRQDKTFRCEQNHSFDIARQGYINLLPVQQKHSLNPGDTRQQVLARREFLEAGFYTPIVDTLIRTAKSLQAGGPLLDIGCGEGYYSTKLAAALQCELVGLDISKEAVRCASAKYKDALWICATASHLPVADQSVGLLTSLFALTMAEEFARCLRSDGYYFQVLAAKDHLLGLKSIIYPELKFKEKDTVPEIPGFRRIQSEPIRFTFTAEGAQVQHLLSMTPHAHRITKEGYQRLAQTQRLTDTASCVLNVFEKDTQIPLTQPK